MELDTASSNISLEFSYTVYEDTQNNKIHKATIFCCEKMDLILESRFYTFNLHVLEAYATAIPTIKTTAKFVAIVIPSIRSITNKFVLSFISLIMSASSLPANTSKTPRTE